MEFSFMNKCELCGIVGQSSLNRVGDSQLCRFSLATEYSYKANDGTIIVETCWFQISVWAGKGIHCNLDLIVRGAKVHLTGRLKCCRYTDTHGVERTMYEVLAHELEILED